MASTILNITDVKIDRSNDLWITGRDVVKFNGSTYDLYNFQNSAVPSNDPYFLDTRSISIDPNGDKWIGTATSEYVSDVLVFQLIGEYAEESAAWTLSQIGLSGKNWEVGKIYASPYGNEIIAFFTDLNGGSGVTGSTGATGFTGGYLYSYDTQYKKWTELANDYNWSHVYEIKSSPMSNGEYSYCVATDVGVITFKGGGKIYTETLLDNDKSLKEVDLCNQYNSPLPSSIVYSVDYDEDGNLWIGTDGGLVYRTKEDRFYVWDTSNLPSLPNNKITIVKSINNGQVLFTCGDGYTNEGNGIFYFNGNSLFQYTSSNSSLPNNNVTEIVSFDKKSKNGDRIYYPNEVLVACQNDLCLIDYVVPHIYASAKETGSSGWDFIYYTPSDNLDIPRVDRYSWVYPSWRTYQDSYLTNKIPGVDKRDLFLDVPLSDLANQSAGKREYWSNGEIPEYSNEKYPISIDVPDWISGITGSSDVSSNEVLTEILGRKRIVCFSTPSDNIFMGIKANGESVYVDNPNPTVGGTAGSCSYIVYYNQNGQLEGYNTIRGYDVEIQSIEKSPDSSSIIISGIYKGYIEAGEFLYSSDYLGGNSLGGPIGSPIGVSNLEYSIAGPTSEYPWIWDTYSGETGSPYIPSGYTLPDNNWTSVFLMEIDPDIGNSTSFGNIDFSNSYEVQKKYTLRKFRSFPVNSSFADVGSVSVTKNRIRAIGRILQGNSPLYLYPNGYKRRDDLAGLPESIGDDSGTWNSFSYYLSLDRSFNLLDGKTIKGNGDFSRFFSISTEKGRGSSIISGVSSSVTSVSFGDLEIYSGPTANQDYYILLDNNDKPYISGTSERINFDTLPGAGSSHNSHYFALPFSGPTADCFGTVNDPIEDPLGVNVLEVLPSGSNSLIFTYGLTGDNSDYIVVNSQKRGVSFNDKSIFINTSYVGLSSGNAIQRITGIDIEEPHISFNSIYGEDSNNFTLSNFSYSLGENEIFFSGGNNLSATGPDSLPVPQTDQIFSGRNRIRNFASGKFEGEISSIAGQNPWKYVDVHRDTKNMSIPLGSTVFMVNYNSNIFGKKNYRWVLSDHKTGQEILDVKGTTYFIYTFNKPGYYSIFNSVEDSNGNTYEVSKNAYIEVIDHREKRIDDPNQFVVDSYDYGYIPNQMNQKDRIKSLSDSLAEDERKIKISSVNSFGSGIVVPNNPDATFRSI